MSHSLAEHYHEILVGIGENPQREGLLDTPGVRQKRCSTCATGMPRIFTRS